jgi:hypothetical protein
MSDDPNVVVSSRLVKKGESEGTGTQNPLGDVTVSTDDAVVKEMSEAEIAKAKEDALKVPSPPGPLKYPYHREGRYPACIKFSIKEVHGAAIEGVPDILTGLKEKFDLFVSAAGGDAEKIAAAEKAAEAGQAKRDANGDSEAPVSSYERTDVTSGIKIYLPQGFSTGDALQYSNADLGMTGAAALNAFNNGGGFGEAIGEMFKTGFGSLTDASGNGKDLAQLTIARNAKGILGKLMPDELQLPLQLSSAVTVNPNTRAMFKGVGLRTFQFQFKFLPVSEREAQEVEEIIKRFRLHAYPESIQAGAISAGYKYPHMFDITLTANGQPIGTKIKTCVLESITTSYNASSMAWHKGPEKSYASEYDLTLSFREEVALNAQDIRDGF